MAVRDIVDAVSFDRAQRLNREIRDVPFLVRPEHLKLRGWNAAVLPGNTFAELGPALVSTMAVRGETGFFVVLEGIISRPEFYEEHKDVIPNGDPFKVNWLELGWFLEKYSSDLSWCLSLDATQDDLLELDQMYGHLYNLIVPESESFLILSAAEDYNILAGPREFIESTLGESFDDAWKLAYSKYGPEWFTEFDPVLAEYEHLS